MTSYKLKREKAGQGFEENAKNQSTIGNGREKIEWLNEIQH